MLPCLLDLHRPDSANLMAAQGCQGPTHLVNMISQNLRWLAAEFMASLAISAHGPFLAVALRTEMVPFTWP